MKIESIVLASTLLLAAFSSGASAQQIVIQSPDDLTFLGQAAPPATPSTPLPALGALSSNLVRLMATNGSYLGVGVRDVDTERKKVLKLKEERGAEITSVEDESPAAKAGLKTGDVVLDYSGARVDSMEQFIRLVRETPAGREVKIMVSRAGNMTPLSAKPENGQSRMARTIKIAPMPQIDVSGWATSMDSPRVAMLWKSSAIGVEAESLDSQLADFFGVKQGVLVRSVVKESAAEKAGVKAGDVIVKVEDTKVSSPREVTSAVRTARNSSKTVNLSVVREKKDVAIKLAFDEEIPAAGPPPASAPRGRTVQNKFQ